MFTLSPALREHIGGSSGTDRGELDADRGEFGDPIDTTSAPDRHHLGIG